MNIATIPTSHCGKFKEHEIYIGAQRGNLTESQWYRPKLKSLSLYREAISKCDLDWIQKDTILLCVCNFWKKCHGHVLLYLAMKKNGMISNVIEYDAFSPFSHTYESPLIYAQKTFKSLAHAYYWEKSRNGNINIKRNLLLLHKLLSLKFEQCKSFRELLIQHKNDYLVQNTTHPFWGKGEQGNEIKVWSGQNIGGWMIMHLLPHDLARNRRKLIYVCEGEVNTSFMKGLQLIDKHITKSNLSPFEPLEQRNV